MKLGAYRVTLPTLFAILLVACLIGQSAASLGDHLPDFKECVQVSFIHWFTSKYGGETFTHG